jgi:DNA-binding transcriptional MerR regulator
VRMLRHYDELGLLKPNHIDATTGYRYYTLEQLPRLNRILALKDLGLPLTELRALLDDMLSADEIRGMLKLRQAQLREHIAQEQARLKRVEDRLKYIEQENRVPDVDVVMKAQPALHGISICSTTWVGRVFAEVSAELKAQNLWQIVRGTMTIYHGSLEFERTRQKPTEPLSEAVFLVDSDFQQAVSLPNKRMLQVCRIPSYPLVASVVSTKQDGERALDFQALWRWMDSNRFRLAAPTREVYLKRPFHNETYLTEIQFPVIPIQSED